MWQTLQTGGTLLIDDLETNLDPAYLHEVINLFQNRNINRYNAQLLFSTNHPMIKSLLKDDEICKVFKFYLEAHVHRLSDV